MDLTKFEKDHLKSSNLGLVTFNHTMRYSHEYKLFLLHFNTIPNSLREENINCKKLMEWVTEHLNTRILDVHYQKRKLNGSKRPVLDDVYFIVANHILLYIDNHTKEVKLLYRNSDQALVQEIKSEIQNCVEQKEQKPTLSLLTSSESGLRLNRQELERFDLDVSKHYNDDFFPIHQHILKRLSNPRDKGLVLLHGKAGTGKTSYIRHLISVIKKPIIYIPSTLANRLDDPSFLELLLDKKNSILVIEDAEQILLDRGHKTQTSASTILNLTDGLLSDCLNIQIICTFNSTLSKIDSALLRKGRLIARYEFNELEAKKATELSHQLGSDKEYQSPQRLTEVYNHDEPSCTIINETPKIGF